MTVQPYIGLRPFEREDSSIFFGRDLLVGDLLQRLRHSPFVAVLGLSGEGKSSLVRAGLIPALEAGYLDYEGMGWAVAMMTPGVNPLGALAEALCASPWGKNYKAGQRALFERLSANPGTLRQIVRTTAAPKKTRLLIVVDQFEELFTRDDKRDANTKADTRLFVAQLLDAALRSEKKIYVLLTMRSEFIGHCAEYPALAHAITRGVFLVPRMRDSELAEAIEMPARRCGGEVESELAHLLIEQLKGDTTLPVLQHLLMRMWNDATSEAQQQKGEKEAVRSRSQAQTRQSTKDKGEPRSNRGPLLTREYLAKFANPGVALDNDLDEAFRGSIGKKFTPGQQRATEAIFRRITKQTGWNEKKKRYEYARDPATVAEIARVADVAPEDVCAVVEAFREQGRTFLKASGQALGPESLIDLTHEAVINNWERAQKWAANEAENARQFQQLREWAARASKDEKGRYATETLLKGSDLEQKRRWFETARVHSLGPSLSEQWAERYVQHDDHDVRGHGRNAPDTDAASAEVGLVDFKQAVDFLNASRAEAEREELREAIKGGDIEKVASLVERGVRLTKKLLTRSESREARGQASGRWEYAAHYYAAVPEPDTPEEEEAHPEEGASVKTERSEERHQPASLAIDQQWLEEHLPATKELPYSTLGLVRVQHYAAWGGNVEVLKYVRQQALKFDPENQRKLALDAQTERGLRPFDLALGNGQLEAAKWIFAQLGNANLIRAEYEQHGGATVLHLFIRDWSLARARARASTRDEVKARYSAVMRWLLDEQRADVNKQDKDGLSPLHWAVDHGNAEAVRMLIEKSPKLDARDLLGRTPLFLAAIKHKDLLVTTLIDHGADVSIADGDGDTPLLACLRAPARDVPPAYATLRLLLKKTNDASDINPFTGENALHMALDRQDPWGETNAILVALIENKARIDVIDDKGRTPMSLALDKGREDVAVYFFHHRHAAREGEQLYGDWMTQAVRAGARDLLREMLSRGASADALNADDDAALHVAADRGDTGAILDLLLYSNAITIDIEDAGGLTPLRRALLAGEDKAASMLLDEGAAPPEYMAPEELEIAEFAAIELALKQRLGNSATAEWASAPIMPGAWQNLDPGEAAKALYRLFESDPDFVIQMRAERIDAVRALPLTCLVDAKLYEARFAPQGQPPGYVLFVQHASACIWLTGQPPWTLLRSLVGAMDFSTQEKAREFLFLHAGANSWDRGALRFVEAPDDIAGVPSEMRARVAAIAAPIQLTVADGVWTGEAVAQYGHELWRTGIELKRDGELWIGGESAGVSGLPFAQASYKNGLRTVTPFIGPSRPASEAPPSPSV